MKAKAKCKPAPKRKAPSAMSIYGQVVTHQTALRSLLNRVDSLEKQMFDCLALIAERKRIQIIDAGDIHALDERVVVAELRAERAEHHATKLAEHVQRLLAEKATLLACATVPQELQR